MMNERGPQVELRAMDGSRQLVHLLGVHLESIRKRLSVFSALHCDSVIELLRWSWTELSDHEVYVTDLNHRLA